MAAGPTPQFGRERSSACWRAEMSVKWNGTLVIQLPRSSRRVGVKIRRENGFELFGPGSHPVLRGTAMRPTQHLGYLWTLGYIPRLGTYPGREVPNPPLVGTCREDADLALVMQDVLGLTKVNFSACDPPPLPFRHYI